MAFALEGPAHQITARPLTLHFYVPPGTRRVVFNSGAKTLSFTDPEGNRGEMTDRGPAGLSELRIPEGRDGKVWQVNLGPSNPGHGLMFFNVPNVFAPARDGLLVPRELFP